MNGLASSNSREALVAIQAAIRTALGLCDNMGLSMVGIHLDGARLAVEAELERCGFGEAVDTTPIVYDSTPLFGCGPDHRQG
jgi:hypothetical protein